MKTGLKYVENIGQNYNLST